jgi:two-component system chemotaxis sensor kinase CheA
MDDLLEQFVIESRDLIAEGHVHLAVLERRPDERAAIDGAFRAVHTLKGSVAIFDMVPALRALHAAEDVLDKVRSGTARLGGAQIAALIDTLDQSDRWVEAIEHDGTLPAAAATDSAVLVARLGGAQVAARTEGPAMVEDWALALAGELGDTRPAGALVAFCYEPDPDCFFRGDDPLAVVAAVPDLAAFDIAAREPFPPLSEVEPFRCNMRLTGISAASREAVQAAFRLVADQVRIAGVPATSPLIAPPRSDPAAVGRSFRVDAARIDAIADGVGELVVATNALRQVAQRAERVEPTIAADIRSVQGTLDRIVGEMRGAVTAVRMVSIAPTLRRLPRMVRELATATGRDVALTMQGETTEIDKAIADELFEPLLHLVRNAVDHGIELAAERAAAGKPTQGMITLSVAVHGRQVEIRLRDDGRGINPARIREVAVARGLLVAEAAEALDDDTARRLIFAPGFSTTTNVTDVSGRGVGMDAVQAAIERLGGRIELTSVVGEGTTIALLLPLHAITTKLLIVEVGDDRFGVPLEHIIETATLDRSAVFPIGRGRACVHRNRTLPLLSLAHLLDHTAAERGETKLIVMGTGTDAVGITVTAFKDRIDAMVRPPRGLLAHVSGITGTTLLGDGGVLLVLDLPGLAA